MRALIVSRMTDVSRLYVRGADPVGLVSVIRTRSVPKNDLAAYIIDAVKQL
jgi:hypothetical protein